MCGYEEQVGGAPPGYRRYVPRKAQRSDGECCAAKKLWQLLTSEQPNENIALAKIRVGKSSDEE